MFLLNDSVKAAKIRHVFAKLHRIVLTKVSLCLQINGKQNRLRAKKGPAPPLGNFADTSYLKENFKPHLFKSC